MRDDGVVIRAAQAADDMAIRRLLLSAFPTAGEADLVTQLHGDGAVVHSLVALDGADVVGHVMLSRMTAPFAALGLAPLAVKHGWRRKNIAGRLVEAAIAEAAAGGAEGIFVLGDPVYYARFGFSAAAASGFETPYAGDHFMLRSLGAHALPVDGAVAYAPAFGNLE
jgi:putative acetyltransferase